jgi:hypothetical protein
MADEVITKMEKNSQEEIRFSLQEYRGTDLVDIRVYYDGGSSAKIPTKKGISIPIERFEELMECLRKAKKTISEKQESVGYRDYRNNDDEKQLEYRDCRIAPMLLGWSGHVVETGIHRERHYDRRQGPDAP